MSQLPQSSFRLRQTPSSHVPQIGDRSLRGDHRIRSIKHGKGCNDHSMKRRRTRTRLQLVPETTGGRLVCGKELLFSWRCSHSRFTRETSSLPCFRYRILPSRLHIQFLGFLRRGPVGKLGPGKALSKLSRCLVGCTACNRGGYLGQRLPMRLRSHRQVLPENDNCTDITSAIWSRSFRASSG